MKPVGEKGSMRERMKEVRRECRGEERYERKREIEFNGEERRKRIPRSREIWRVIMCPVNRFRWSDQVNGKRAEFRFLDQVAGKPKRSLYAREEPRGALPELSVPVTSRVYFSSAAQLYGHLHGNGVHVFEMCRCESLMLRETHIFISLLKEERKVGAKKPS